jgi:hypothetical protein
MCCGSATKAVAAVVLIGAALGGCSDIYFDRREGVSIVSGEAMAANRVTHMIDPWPAASGQRNIAYSGDKAAVAAERYRTGRVIQPINPTTSSAAYGSQTPNVPVMPSQSSNSTNK